MAKAKSTERNTHYKRAWIEEKEAKVKLKRARRKEKTLKRKLDQFEQQGYEVGPEGLGMKHICQMCGQEFASGNKVHQHIRADHPVGEDGCRKNDARTPFGDQGKCTTCIVSA